MTFIFKILLTTIISFIIFTLRGQDAYFSQFFANRLYLNPGLAGIEEYNRLTLNYRNQWPSAENSFVTYQATYDQFVEPLHGGVGIKVFNDYQGEGIISEFGISGIYSYHLYASRSLTINAGFEASYVQRRLNTSNFIYGDMLNPDGSINSQGAENYGNFRTSYPDFAMGITGLYKNFYTGTAVYHLLKPVHSLSSDPDALLSRKFTYFAGGIIPVYEKRLGKEVIQISPNIIYVQQRNLSQLNYGMEFLYESTYVAGIWLRQNLGIEYSSLIFSAGITANKIRLRYSYDFQLSHPSISLPALGSHEISLILLMNAKKKKKQRAINCLKI